MRGFVIACLLWLTTYIQLDAQIWNSTGSLGSGRYIAAATLLTNGKVLVAGGSFGCGIGTLECRTVNSPEIYDPVSGAWSVTGNMTTSRTNHFAVRLTNGKVLVAGGLSGSFLNTAELYDPLTGTWSATGNPIVARSNATITLLQNGKVLVAGGGSGSAFGAVNTAELYDPATGTWSATGSMNVARNFHTATLLADGKVLVAGGTSGASSGVQTLLASAEIYDLAAGAWTLTGSLGTMRVFHTANLLPNGKVLVTGGSNFVSIIYNTAEIYDPATRQWTATPRLASERISHTATLLPNGKVLVTGGFNSQPTNSTLKSAELYDPATANWSTTADLATPRGNHSAVLLGNGAVLVTGGNGGGSLGHSATELFDSGVRVAASVSAASYAAGASLAPDSIVSAFGSNLAAGIQQAPGIPLPTELGGVSIKVKDSADMERTAGIFSITPQQVAYLLPADTNAGIATVTVVRDGVQVAVGVTVIAAVSPGLFAANANGRGVAAAIAVHVKADGTQNSEVVARFDLGQNAFVAAPIDLGPASEQVVLQLYGTGIKLRGSLSAVRATVGGANADVLFAGAAPGFAGLDQVNVLVPRTLTGRGDVDIVLSVDGNFANTVTVNFR